MSTPEAMLTFIAERDHSLMRRVHRWRAPRWIRVWMIAATRGGDGWLWLALGWAVWLCGGSQAARVLVAGVAAAALGVVAFVALKRATGRRRPCEFERHCWSTLLPPDRFSFPSGHTISAFAVTTPVGCAYPEWAPGLTFLALSVAASRILLGMHFLSDVVAGALLGTAFGYLAYGSWLGA